MPLRTGEDTWALRRDAIVERAETLWPGPRQTVQTIYEI